MILLHYVCEGLSMRNEIGGCRESGFTNEGSRVTWAEDLGLGGLMYHEKAGEDLL